MGKSTALALTAEEQAQRINDAKQSARAYPGNAVYEGRHESYYLPDWSYRCAVVFEDSGIGVVTRQKGDQMHIGIAIVPEPYASYDMRICFASTATRETVRGHIERATKIALQLIRLRQGGWAFSYHRGMWVHSPISDERSATGRDAVAYLPATTKGYDKSRPWSKRLLSADRVLDRLAALPDSPDMSNAAARAATQAAKRATIAAARAAEAAALAAERERALADAATAATEEIATSAREHLLTEAVISASPELSAAETLAVIDRVAAEIGERPSTAMLAAIERELTAAREQREISA